MKCLYAPWRSHYTESVGSTKKEDAQTDECVFCAHLQQDHDDSKNYVLKRFSHTAVLFNRYPYNAGHLLIIPIEHIGNLEHLSKETSAQLMAATTASTVILKKKARPDGFNIGLNLGKMAGASIPAHLHMHLLPRWTGDTNFLPTLTDTKVISFDLEKMYLDLKPEFDAITL